METSKRSNCHGKVQNIGRDSGVIAYEIGDDFIKVEFDDRSLYLYNYGSAGRQNIEEMKKLAVVGEGLNSYINRYVKKAYASKLR